MKTKTRNTTIHRRARQVGLCLALLMTTARGEERYPLLPAPQQITYHDGTCQLPPGSHVWVDPSGGKQLLSVAEDVRGSLKGVYGALKLSASNGSNTSVEIRVLPDRVRRAQGYELSVLPERIRIVAHDQAGAFYAAQTLKQMCRVAAGKLRCLQVRDWPDYPNRGVMLDISRDKVPTMPSLYQLVDKLAEFKINQFQLYTEHTFAYQKHKKVWKDASPMTAGQIKKLDKYCADRHIELVPNQNSFGHLKRWLKHEPYRQMAEAPDGCNTDWGWQQGLSLCATDPRAVEFLAGLYDELLPNFTSRQINVGCDETVDLGCARTKEICKKKGKGRVYLDFIKKIHGLVSSHGRTMMMWGDIVMKHPELVSELPDGIIVLEWGYEAKHPFDENCKKYANAGVPFYVCPGTSTWETLTGRMDNSRANLLSAAINGKKHGAIGFLNTHWGDRGHREPLPVSYPAYTYGAAVSWSIEANKDMDLPTQLDRHVFLDQNGVMGKLIHDLGNTYKIPGVLITNRSILSNILLKSGENFNRGAYSKLSKEKLEETIRYVDQVMAPLEKSSMQISDAKHIKEELVCAANLLRHSCRLGIARIEAPEKKIANIPAAQRAELTKELDALIVESKRLWLVRNRPGGLKDSIAHLERLRESYQQTQP